MNIVLRRDVAEGFAHFDQNKGHDSDMHGAIILSDSTWLSLKSQFCASKKRIEYPSNDVKVYG